MHAASRQVLLFAVLGFVVAISCFSLFSFAHADTDSGSVSADATCTSGDYTCDYPAKSTKKPGEQCMYGKPCQSSGDNASGMCIAVQTCKATQVKTESGGETTPQQATPGTGVTGSNSSPQVTPDTNNTTPTQTESSGSNPTTGATTPPPSPQTTPQQNSNPYLQQLQQTANQAGITPGQSLLQQSINAFLNPNLTQSNASGLTSAETGAGTPALESTPQGNGSPSENTPQNVFSNNGTFTSGSTGAASSESCGTLCTIGNDFKSAASTVGNAVSYVMNNVFTSPAAANEGSPPPPDTGTPVTQTLPPVTVSAPGTPIELPPVTVEAPADGKNDDDEETGNGEGSNQKPGEGNGQAPAQPQTPANNNVLTTNSTVSLGPWQSQLSSWADLSTGKAIVFDGNVPLQLNPNATAPVGGSPVYLQVTPSQVTPDLANLINANGGWAYGTLQPVATEITLPPPTPTPTPTPTPVADNSSQPQPENPVVAENTAPQTQPQAQPEQPQSSQTPVTTPSEPTSKPDTETSASPANTLAPSNTNPQTSPTSQTSPTAQPAPAANSTPANSGPSTPASGPTNVASNGSSGGGATGGNPNSAGGSQDLSSFLSSFLKGFTQPSAGSSAPAASGQAQPTTPIVAAPNQPLVALTAPSANGELTPCPGSSANQQQTQTLCSTSSTAPSSGSTIVLNLPNPQLVASLNPQAGTANSGSSGQGQSTSGSSPQNVIPGKSQSQGTGSTNPTTSTGVQTANNAPQTTQTTPAGQQGSATQSGSNSASGQTKTSQGQTQQSGSGGTGSTAANSGQSAGNGSSGAPTGSANQSGPSGTSNPSGSQQGGTGNTSSAAGNSAGSQTSTQASCGFGCKVAQALDKVFGFLGPNSANAAEGPPNQAALDRLKRDVQSAEQGLQTFTKLFNTSSEGTSAEKAVIDAGRAAASRLAGQVNGTLKAQLNNYVAQINQLDATYKSCNGGYGCLFVKGVQGMAQGVVDTGHDLLPQVANYVNGQHVQPPAVIGPIGQVATNQPSVAPIANNAAPQPNPNPVQNPVQNNTAPPPQTAPSTAQQLVAKAAPITGAASVYDCRLGGINGNCGQNGTGGFVNPGEYSAALRLSLAKVFQTGTGSGNVGYALVENTDTGRQMIVRVNDNGPLDNAGARVIDLTPASMNCLGYGVCNNDSTLRSTVLPNVKVTLLQGNYTPGVVQNGVLPTGPTCNYQGCTAPAPTAQVAAARVPGLTALPAGTAAPSSAKTMTDPTTGASFSCTGDAASCVSAFQQQAALSRLCASNPTTCNSTTGTFTLKPNGNATPGPEPRKVISIQSNYGAIGKLAQNPNVPTVSGISNQDFINKLRAAGVPVQDMSSASLSGYPHGKNQMAALTWHGDGSSGNGSGLVQTEINQNNSGQPAAQMVLQQDGTLVLVAPADAVSFHAATTNKMGPGIEIQGMNNTGANPTPAQTATMQKITDVVMNQLGWQVGTHGAIEPSHKDALEAGPATIAYVYQGVAPGPVPTYTLTDANNNPVVGPNGQPITTTQAPGAGGTGQFLTNSDGSLQLDANGKPIPVNPVQITQDPTDPNKYNAPDDRPEQPKPANPWHGQTAGNPYPQQQPLSATPVGQPTQPRPQVAQAQPPQQTLPQQPIPQPLPQPILPTTPSATATSTPANPVVTIVANPTSIAASSTSKVSWSSVGTSACTVSEQNGAVVGTTTKGSVSPTLLTTTLFTASCQTNAGTTITASTSVKVYTVTITTGT